jgi:tRNA threonylcarbamoyladenosine biosynthesis protein TsaE
MEIHAAEIVSTSVEETRKVAAALAACLQAGSVIALDGDLGAGKTHFTQGLAAGLGITTAVTSPTFNVLSAYVEGRLPLYHFDLYRLEDVLELEDIAFYDYVESDGVSCVEWASKFEEEMPENTLWITITTGENNSRTIRAHAANKQTKAQLDAWFASLDC